MAIGNFKNTTHWLGHSHPMNVFVLIDVELFRGGRSSLPKNNLMLTLNFM